MIDRPHQAIVNRECRRNGQRALAYGRHVRLFIIRNRWRLFRGGAGC